MAANFNKCGQIIIGEKKVKNGHERGLGVCPFLCLKECPQLVCCFLRLQRAGSPLGGAQVDEQGGSSQAFQSGFYNVYLL